MREPALDRRAFVRALAGAAAAPLLGACASLVARPVTAIDGRIELALQQYPELTEPGGWLKLQPTGHAEPVYVLLLDSGDVAALSPVCTHLGCRVDIQGRVLVCPCHGSTYDREGRVLRGPAALPLAHYAVERSPDGNVIIDLRRRS